MLLRLITNRRIGIITIVVGSAILGLLYFWPFGHPDWPAWLTATGTIGLAVVGALGLRQLSEVRSNRAVAVLADIGRRWDEDSLREAREKMLEYTAPELMELAEKLVQRPKFPQARREFIVLFRIPNFFEDMALIVESSKVPTSVVARGFKEVIVDEWTQWEPLVRRFRETEPNCFAEFERLADQMRLLSSA
jgi:hypothetical protein